MPLLEKDQAAAGAASADNGPGFLQTLQMYKVPLLAALLIVATLLLYGQAANHQFLNYDDDQYVTDNPHVISGLSVNNVEWAFRTLRTGNWHPLTWVSHMLDCQLFGLNPAGHHYSSVLLHAANVFLLFVLLRKATGATWRSFLVAALFAIHPLNVESVAWVAERKTLLSAFFCFLTLAAYGWYAKQADWRRYLVVAGTFILALMAKPMAVTMPVALLLVDYWPLRRFAPSGENAQSGDPATVLPNPAVKLVLEKVPLLLISAGASILAIVAQRSTGALDSYLSISVRLKNAAVAYATYIEKAFWPSRLSIFYPHPQASIPWSSVALALLLLLAISALAIRFRRERYLVFGWLFFLLALLPVIGIVQVGGQAMADRYAYTPLIGIFIIVVWGTAEAAKSPRIRPLLAVAAICALTGLAFATNRTLQYWQNSLTLFTHAERVTSKPDVVIETNLGEAYSFAGLPDEAIRHFETARALDPNCGLALYDIGNYLFQKGRNSESIEMYQLAIRHSPSEAVTQRSFHNIGSAFLLLGDYPRAERSYTAALQMDPSAYPSLAGRGQAFYADGKFAEAANDFSRALKLNPDPPLFVWEGKALERQQKFEQALAAYSVALQGAPDSAEIQTRISELRKRMATQNAPAR